MSRAGRATNAPAEYSPFTHKTIDVLDAAETAGVSVKTIYRWIDFDLILFTRTSSGTLRIYRDSLFDRATSTQQRKARAVEIDERRAMFPRVKDSTFHGKHFSERPCGRKCGGNRDLPYSVYCRECRNAYAREHRPSHSQLTSEARKRANCRSYTNTLIERGALVPAPCEDCGTGDNVQPHHDDYDKPREVRWKCQNCHREHHRRERRAAKQQAAADRESRYIAHGLNAQSETSGSSSEHRGHADAE